LTYYLNQRAPQGTAIASIPLLRMILVILAMNILSARTAIQTHATICGGN